MSFTKIDNDQLKDLTIKNNKIAADAAIEQSKVLNLETDLIDKVSLSGGTMSGPLILNADPTDNLGAVTKQYVDSIPSAATKVSKSGDTMTGPLILNANPTLNLEASTKQYVDNTTVSLSGDTMTGALVLNADPSLDLHAVTKQYTDSFGRKNYIWNGSFQVWQRNTVFSSFFVRQHTADGFSFARTSFSSGSTLSRQAGNTGQYCLRVSRDNGDTSTDDMNLIFNLSQDESFSLINQPVVLSFWAKASAGFSSSGNQLTVEIKENTSGTEQSITSDTGVYTLGDNTALSSNIILTTTWQKFILLTTISSSSIQEALRFSYTPSGTAANDYFEIEQIKLEIGTSPTALVTSSFSQTLLIAKQQFIKSWDYNTPIESIDNAGALRERARGTESDSAININIILPVSMRAIPTVSVYSPNTGTIGKIYDETGLTDLDASTANIGTNGFTIINNSPTIDGNLYSGHWVAESTL